MNEWPVALAEVLVLPAQEAMAGTYLDSKVGKSQTKLPTGHHGFSEPPVVTAYSPPAWDPIHLHLHLHHSLFGVAPTSQAHL